MTLYARYIVIVDRQLGESDGQAFDYHDGKGPSAVAQLSKELQEAWDTGGVSGHFRITGRAIVDTDDVTYDDLHRLPTDYADDPDDFDPIDLTPLVDGAVAALNSLVMVTLAIPSRKAALPEWLTKAIEKADLAVNQIQDHLVDPTAIGSTYEDRISSTVEQLVKLAERGGVCSADDSLWIKNYLDLHGPDDPAGHGGRLASLYPQELDEWHRERTEHRPHFPRHRLLRWLAEYGDVYFAYPGYDATGVAAPATHWYYQTGDQWMAVANEDEADWFEDRDAAGGWPTPRTYPIDRVPGYGQLIYRHRDGGEVRENV